MTTTEDQLTAPERRQLDELVPAPWSSGRRALGFAAACLGFALIVGAVLSGAVGPRLSHADSSGAAVTGNLDSEQLEATRVIILRNDGLFEVSIEKLVLPRIEGVTWGQVQDLPATVASGEEHEFELSFSTAGCSDIDVDGYNVFPVRASGGILGSRTIEVAPPGVWHSTTRTTYVGNDGTELTLPQWPEQPVSWILDTIEPVCASPPEAF